MKKAILSIITLALCCAIALGEVNTTLEDAQALYQKAKTEADYKNARAKFETARYDPSYDKAEHEAQISKGIKDCDAKIAQLSVRLTVSPQNVAFDHQGGSTTLSVSSNKGRPTVKSNASWLTVDDYSATSITFTCAPNSGADSRTATITVSAGGASVSVKATQDCASLIITGVEFGSADASGAPAGDWGHKLLADAVCYVAPRISYTSPKQQTKTISTKIYKSGSQAPQAYTQTSDCTLKAGSNTLLYPGYGSSTPGTIAPGTYTYEVWADGELAYSATFAIREVFDGVRFGKIEFGADDGKGNPKVHFGGTLYADDVCFVKPRVEYTSPATARNTAYVKVYKPDGSLWTLPSSPEGYTMARDITFQEGSKTFELSGLGDATPQFDLGEYKYEIWIDGRLALASTFTIKQKEELNIRSVTFSFFTKDGYGVAQPSISYSNPSHQTKKVGYKYYDPSGKLITYANSPTGYTAVKTQQFAQGKKSFIGEWCHTVRPGKLAPGTYTLQIWIDGRQCWQGTFEINSPAE